MSLDQEIRAAVTRALAALDASAEIELREAQEELRLYFADQMQSATSTNYVTSKLTGRRRALKNNTDKLFILYGKLSRALIPKQPGNIGIYEKKDKERSIKIGIDLQQVPYARAHEFGHRYSNFTLRPRPFLFPAIKLYSQQEFRQRLIDITEAMVVAWEQK